jgi:hypothetical protein
VKDSDCFIRISLIWKVIEKTFIDATILSKRSLSAIISLIVRPDTIPRAKLADLLSNSSDDSCDITPNDKGEGQRRFELAAHNIGIDGIDINGKDFYQHIPFPYGRQREVSIVNMLKWTWLLNIRCFHRCSSSSRFFCWLVSDPLTFVCHVWWSHNQEWKPGAMQDTLGDTAHHPPLQPAIPMRCHRDHLRAAKHTYSSFGISSRLHYPSVQGLLLSKPHLGANRTSSAYPRPVSTSRPQDVFLDAASLV